MGVDEVLAANREVVIQRWKDLVRGKLAPESMPPLELVDHLPAFLDETVAALADDARRSPSESVPEGLTTAAGHGAQRLRLGFRIDAVVHEFGALRNAIIQTLEQAGAPLRLPELQIIFDQMIQGIADSVSEYARQRDAELSRQANEHFAFIAHELRNPLSTATLAFQQLEAKGLLPSDDRGVSALRRGLAHASQLIEHSLQTARLASGIELRRQWTTLRALLEDAELGASSEAAAKGIELRLVVEQDARVHVDVRLIQSAVSNLLRNGVKYTPPAGRVDLRGRISDARLTIEVEDRCGGLAPGKVEAAFAPFVRMDDSESGFGLGLAIAKQAVEAHGGTIRVQNLPGTGCIFILELPYPSNTGAAAPASPRPDPEGAHTPHA
ncbi:MAG TPA: sensor histidine kinase [Polyangiaceae bacterium]|nr:sensor histidine kinase [Polyangiaceae bacterium]